MVDKERRKKLALHLRHLSVGLTTNDDFEEAIMEDVSEGCTLYSTLSINLSWRIPISPTAEIPLFGEITEIT